LEQFKADCAFAGVPLVDGAGQVIDLHGLRHRFAQMLAREGVHPRTAQTMLRHRDIRTTMAIYIGEDLTAQSRAVAALPVLEAGRQVRQNVQRLAHPATQGGATPCKSEVAGASRKSGSVETWGKSMQGAAAGAAARIWWAILDSNQ